jgi:hypothetical protein
MVSGMIVSASYRTDIPAFYGAWFLARLAAGYAAVASPYGGPPYRVALDAASVSGFAFWTRNIAPFRPALDAVKARGTPFTVQFTITGYPHALERAVIAPDAAATQLRALADEHGPRIAVWRYDPILLTSLTPPAWQRANFARLAASLAGATDEVTVSFAQIYRKTRRNLDAAARAGNFAWHDPDPAEKRALVAGLAEIADSHRMRLTVCAQPDLIAPPAAAASCIDATRLSDVAGRPIAARRKGNRPGCDCSESRDIGAYDTCPHGCAYCYAVSSHTGARRRHRDHDPAAEGLAPALGVKTPTATA